MKKITILLFFGLALYCQAQNEFPIGIWSPPNVKIGLTPCPADYNGDGLVDLAVKTDGGYWLIDYADGNPIDNGFNGWESPFYQNYGDATAHPVPADYDGDGKADLSVKTDDGMWLIDFAIDGFGSWDLILDDDRGDATALPVPADYNGDGLVDLAVKTDGGYWLIDYADGSPTATKNGFNGWEPPFIQIYGDATEHPVPADYNGDGLADLAVKTDDGRWLIDYAVKNTPNNGFGSWDLILDDDRGNATYHPVPGYYNDDNMADLAVKTDDGMWLIDYADGSPTAINNGFNGWDTPTTDKNYGDASARPFPADYDGDGKTDRSVFGDSFEWLIASSKINPDSWKFICSTGKYTNQEHLGINPEDRAAFKKIKDANIDFVINVPVMNATADVRNNFSKIDYYLKIASLESLGVMVSSHNIMSFHNPDDSLKQQHLEFINHLKGLPQNLKDAISGVYLGDEPHPMHDTVHPEHSNNVKKWTEFFKDYYPEKHIYYNLFPSYYGFSSNSTFEDYLNSYINTNTPDNFSVDHYPFRAGGNFLTSFFHNLSVLKDKSAEKPFWFVIQSNNKEDYDISSYESKLKFLTSSSIAYGAKGISYWSYLDDGFADHPTQYASIKKVNNYLKKVVGPVVLNNKNIATLHKSNMALNNDYPFSASELILNNRTVLRDVSNVNVLVGVFESEKVNDVKTDYLWIVNKGTDSLSLINDTKIYLRGYCVGKIYISQRVDSYNSANDSFSQVTNAYFDAQNNQTIVTIPELTAGEGIMLKVILKRVVKYRDYDGDGKADRSIKTDTGDWKIDYKKGGGFSNVWDDVFHNYGDGTAIPVPADYDGDGITDLSIKADNGKWFIDLYAKNGFGSWSGDIYQNYGDGTDIPAPADYDGDGKADLSIKRANGDWLIDYAEGGFGSWNLILEDNRGNATAHPVPADYDGDGKADLSVKTDDGEWFIDYANNGFNGWDVRYYQRGNITAHPAQADYDGDGLVDISVKTDDRQWKIDYAGNGFGVWDLILNDDRGDITAHPVPADYNGDGMADLSVKTDYGEWFIDYADKDEPNNGYNGWQETLLDNGGIGSVALKQNKTPDVKNISLQNIPNPFKSSTIIKFSLANKPKTAEVHIRDANGKLIDKVILTNKNITEGQITYQSASLQSGVYYYYLISNNKIIETNKMIKQ